MTGPQPTTVSLRRRLASTAAVLFLVFSFTGCKTQFGGPEPKLVDYGTYRCRMYLPVTDKTSPTGYVLPLGAERLMKQKDAIEAGRGTVFGCRFYLPPACTNDLRFIYSFPTITNPATGREVNRVEYKIPKPPQNGFMRMLYTFAEDYEITAGKWSFQVFSRDRLVLEKDFQVTKKELKRKPTP
jgi:hypothetical protein